MEVLIAIAIFVILAGGLLILLSETLISTSNSAERNRASFLVTQGLEASRAIKDEHWTDLLLGDHGIDRDGGGNWKLSGPFDITDDTYSRVVNVAPVARDSNGNITESGGTIDPRTKKVTVTVNWNGGTIFLGRSVSRSIYFTDWNVYDWTQTSESDFGDGKRSAVTISGSGTPTSIRLATRTEAWWGIGGNTIVQKCASSWMMGSTSGTAVLGLDCDAVVTPVGDMEWIEVLTGHQFFQTTEAHFITGSFSSTVVVDTGDLGAVSLDTTSAWSSLSEPDNNAHYGVKMISSTDGWAVGATGRFYRWDGTSWILNVDLNNLPIRSVDCLTSTDCWASGDSGKIYHWNGTAWSEFVDNGNTQWNAIVMLSATDGFVAGGGGAIRRFNGTAWNTVTSGTTQNIYDLSMVSSSNVWGSAGSGKVIRWTGGASFSEFVDTGSHTWDSISMVSATDGWVVSATGDIRRWNGTIWNVVTSPTGSALYGVDALSSTFAVAVGAGGTIIQWNGTAWSSATSPTATALNNVDMVSASEGYIVGDSGKFLKYGVSYALSGTYISRVFDAGASVDWNHALWNEGLPDGTNLTISFRSGNTATPDGSWSAWSSEFTDPYGTVIPSPSSRYLQYRVTMTTSDAFVAPRLNSISLTYNEPVAGTFESVKMTSSTNGWAIGAGGQLARYDGSSWSSYSSPTTDNLIDVDCFDASNCWAVGDGGRIIYWNGASWATQTSPTSRTLVSVDVVSTSLVFAVGSAGTILRWNGTSWTALASPTNKSLEGVSMVSASDGWAVGGTGTILRWNGTSWSTWASSTSAGLNAVSMFSATFGVLVGQGGTALHWNGSSWTAVDSTTPNELRDVHCLATDYCWAVGIEQTFMQWNGATWSRYVFANQSNPLIQSVYMVDRTYGWAVGEGGVFFKYTMFYGAVAYYYSNVVDSGTVNMTWNSIFWDSIEPPTTGMTFSTRTGPTPTVDGSWSAWSAELGDKGGSVITSPPGQYIQYRVTFSTTDNYSAAQLQEVRLLYNAVTGQDLYSVHGLVSEDVWAVGRSGTIVHYDDYAWSVIASPVVSNIRSVQTLSSTEAYAVGDGGKILRWNGATWATMTSPVVDDLFSLALTASNSGFAVGAAGSILIWDGATWSATSSPTVNNLRSLSFTDSSFGFAVGDAGTILKWDGNTWVAAASPVVSRLNAVYCLNTAFCTAVGNGGVIIQWDGANWTSQVSPVVSNLNSVEARADFEIWAVGDFGVILTYDGVTWSGITSPTTWNLYDVTINNATDGWVGGKAGILLKDPPAYQSAGTFTSSVIDMDSASSTLLTAYWNVTNTASTALEVMIRNGNTLHPNAFWSAFQTLTSSTGTAITLPPARYAQYRLKFSTTNKDETPVFDDITVTYRWN